MKCAYIAVVEPLYSSVLVGTLLTFPGAALPFVCAWKLAAALVLLPVSAAKVVVGVMLVAENACTADRKRLMSPMRKRTTASEISPGPSGRVSASRLLSGCE